LRQVLRLALHVLVAQRAAGNVRRGGADLALDVVAVEVEQAAAQREQRRAPAQRVVLLVLHAGVQAADGVAQGLVGLHVPDARRVGALRYAEVRERCREARKDPPQQSGELCRREAGAPRPVAEARPAAAATAAIAAIAISVAIAAATFAPACATTTATIATATTTRPGARSSWVRNWPCWDP